jgi:hypothetical protein
MISCAALRDLHRRRACDRGGSQPQPNLTISAHGYVPVAQHAYGRSQTSADRTPASRLIRHASQPVPPPERAGGSTAAWPSLAPCACFSLCSTRGALNFYRRLPNVTSHASPWHAYLRAVYHDDDFPLPFDGLRKMTVWYRDTAAWRARRPAPQVGLPLQSCVGHSKPHEVLFAATDRTSGLRHNRSQPACSEEVCREWLLPDDSRHELKPPAPAPPRPRQQSHSQQQQKSHFSSSSSSSSSQQPSPQNPRTGLTIKHRAEYVEIRPTADASNVDGLWTPPGGLQVQLQVHAALSDAERATAQHAQTSSAWVEVLHEGVTSRAFYEGVDGYGCWFYPAAGSGVFLNVGRAAGVVINPNYGDRRGGPYKTANSSWLLEAYVAAGHSVRAMPTPRGVFKEAEPYAAHALGYDSLSVLRRHTDKLKRAYAPSPLELVVTTRPCVLGDQPVGACPPQALGFRTGAAHQRVCSCSEDAAHGLVLNCQGLHRLS